VLVLIHEDFREHNEATVRGVTRFLGLDDTVSIQALQTKPVEAVRSLALHNLAGSIRAARDRPAAAGQVARMANAVLPVGLRRSEHVRSIWQRAVYTAPPAADQELMLELRHRFKSEVVSLSEYLDRDLVALWGYEHVD